MKKGPRSGVTRRPIVFDDDDDDDDEGKTTRSPTEKGGPHDQQEGMITCAVLMTTALIV